jgi:hypothetical protein
MERFLELSKKQVKLNEKVENERLQEELNENLFLMVNEFVNKIKQYENEIASSSERILHKEETNHVDFNFHGGSNGDGNGSSNVNEENNDDLDSLTSKNPDKEATKTTRGRNKKRKYYVRKKIL